MCAAELHPSPCRAAHRRRNRPAGISTEAGTPRARRPCFSAAVGQGRAAEGGGRRRDEDTVAGVKEGEVAAVRSRGRSPRAPFSGAPPPRGSPGSGEAEASGRERRGTGGWWGGWEWR
jgi:hypothetical protein